MKLTIKTLTGQNIYLEMADDGATVADLMTKIEDVQGIPVRQQRLIFAGAELETGKDLSAYKVKHNSVLHLVLRLRDLEAGSANDQHINASGAVVAGQGAVMAQGSPVNQAYLEPNLMPPPTSLRVQIPPGVESGMPFQVQDPLGRLVTVTCPPGAPPGSTVDIQIMTGYQPPSPAKPAWRCCE